VLIANRRSGAGPATLLRPVSMSRRPTLSGGALQLGLEPLQRGQPLLDVPSQLLRDAVGPQFERLRIQAQEDRAEAGLHLGQHERLLADLHEMVAAHPLRERFRGQLMLALYRSGRQAEALAAYQHAREVLAEELGADPGPDLRRLHARILAADDALAALRRFSLVSPPQDGLVSVHRMVQAVTLDDLDDSQARAWRRAARAVIEAALPEDPALPGTWPAYAALLPHAEIALPPESPGMGQVARFLGFSGSHAAARDLFRQATSACQHTLGTEHPGTLTAQASLADWTGEAGDPAGARDQYLALLPVRERVLGAEHPDTLVTRNLLAYWTGEAGDPAGARDQYLALLPVNERVLGAEHPETLIPRGNLARYVGEAGDPAGARDQYLALLPVMERVLGAEHPETQLVRGNLADWTSRAGNATGNQQQ